MQQHSPAGYRRDIDGLRGLAITLVVVFHVFVGRVSAGVDVFLLIGGIFFFGPQIRNAFNPAGLTVVQSVLRLIRRLYPALVVVVAAILVASLALYAPYRWSSVSGDAVSSLLYVQNFHLAVTGKEYGAVDQGASMFQHMWSLSVQLQIYLGSLLVIVVLAALGARRVIRPLLVLAVVASFGFSIYLHEVDQAWNYYSPLSRFWEIGLGGLAGLWLVHRPFPRRLRWARGPMTAVGLILFTGSGLVLDGAEQFPGPPTLIPLGGALLVILARSPLFEAPVFQFLGRISYSFYLWHWPLLVLVVHAMSDPTAARFTGGTGIVAALGPRGVPTGCVVIACSIALAWATHRFIEAPLRQGAKPARSWVLSDPRYFSAALAHRGSAIAGVGIAALSTVIVASPTLLDRPMSEMSLAELDLADYPGPLVRRTHYEPPVMEPMPPAWADTDSMFPATQSDNCSAIFGDTDVILTQGRNSTDIPCAYGDVDSDSTLYLFGDSHAEHFLPALNIVGKYRNIKIVPVLKMGCSPGITKLLSDELTVDQECEEWKNNAMEWVVNNPPTEGVFLIGTRPPGPGNPGPDPEFVPEGYVRVVSALTDAGVHSWVARDTPWPRPLDVRECVAENYNDAADVAQLCGMPRDRVLAPVNPALEAYGGLDVTLMDFSESFCGPDWCPGVIGNILVYRDGSHVTNVFSAMLAGEVEYQMFGSVTSTL